MTTEIITLLGGTILGGLLKLLAAWQENQRHLVDLAARRQQIDQAATEAADASADKAAARGGPWTRRAIVIAVLFTVFLAPFILAAWFPSVPIFYAYPENTRGFWFFWDSMERLKFARIDGFVLLPIHTQLASAIAGFYFGAGVVKGRG